MTQATRHRAEWHEYGSRSELAAALAAGIGAALGKAVSARGAASLAVSGGRTPQPLFDALAQTAITWDKVTVTLVDERFVPPDNERSNERLVRGHLLQGHAAQAAFVPLFHAGVSLEAAAGRAATAIAALPEPLDVAVLGMGADGHTASFFPDADNLEDLYRNPQSASVLPVHAHSAGEPRLTLSLQKLAAARLIAIHIVGEDRRAVLKSALASGEPPIARLAAGAKTPPRIYWAP